MREVTRNTSGKVHVITNLNAKVERASLLFAIQDVPGSNTGPENVILTEFSHSFPQLLNANAKIVPQITPRPFPFKLNIH